MLKGIIAILTANATVQGLVGQNEAEGKYKVYPVVAPSTEKAPYITVAMIGGARSGKGCGRLMQFMVTSATTSYDDTSALDEAVIDAFDAAAAGTYEGVAVDYIQEMNLSADDYSLEHSLFLKRSTFSCQLGE